VQRWLDDGIALSGQAGRGRAWICAPSPKGWRHATAGLIDLIRPREGTVRELAKFLTLSAVRRRYRWRGGLLVQVAGLRNGRPTVATKRALLSGPDTYLARDMAAVTGTACAAFMLLALEQDGTRCGASTPEDWADPQAFYKALERVGTPSSEIVESVT